MNKIISALVLTLTLGITWAGELQVSGPLQGEVLEKIDAGGYTYLRLKTASGEVWAAITQSPVTVGTRIAIQDPMVMEHFQSKALNRTFDQIVFGSVVDTDPTQTAASAHATAHASAAPTADVPVGKISKAAGADARTVCEVFAQGAKLKGKTVSVRGKVVKYSAGIMDRNWIHLRDGSGSAADHSNDLVVTTKEAATVGDVVTVQGVVRTNADYGAGYVYPVVVENATLKK